MRHRIFVALFVAAVALAQEIPKFEVDPSKWRPNPQQVQKIRQMVLATTPSRCVIRLREVHPVPQGYIQIVRPEPGRKFAANEAKLPAEACARQ
jgi:hypothetical protein